MNPYEAKQEAKKERMKQRSEKLLDQADQIQATASNMASIIPMGQPILVGHHSERRDRNYREKIRNKFQKASDLQKQAQDLSERASSVGSAGISSDDPEAFSKLKEKLLSLESKRDRFKSLNKENPGTIHSFEFTNLSARIRDTKKRIESLESKSEQAQKLGNEVAIFGGVQVVLNREINRVQIIFPSKPGEAARARCKENGFRWAPSENAWQRHLNQCSPYYAAQSLGINSAELNFEKVPM